MEADASIQPDLEVHQQSAGGDNVRSDSVVASASAEPQPKEKWSKTVHPRGRQARDPLAQYVRFQCTGVDQMETYLRDYLADPTSPAEHTTIEFSFPTSSAFLVYTGEYLGGSQPKANLYGTLNRSALSVDAALAPVDKKESLKKQKSIAKTLVEHIQRADGFRYSFHNNWLSKEDEAHRFSYFCNDSTLNKGRAANEGANMDGKRKMKPVYDCHGTLHVKFSVTKQSMELHYKHIPCHKTYEDRAPPPRKNSKRRKIMEVFEPDKLVRERKRKAKAEKPPQPPKRRATEPLPGTADAGISDAANDSLAPLIDFLGSADREAARDTHSPSVPVESASSAAPPIIYPAEKLHQLKKATRRKSSTPRQGVVRPPSLQVPGMMSGYMSGDLITWGSRAQKQRRTNGADPPPSSATASLPSAEPLAGIAQAAAEVTDADATSGMSELELLKAKLAAAEARINRLESEKGGPTTTSKDGPPGWPPPPAPANYSYPPPQFGNVPYSHVQGGPPHGFQYPSPRQGPGHEGVQFDGELRTIHFDPKLVSGGGKKGKVLSRNSNGVEKPRPPPRGGEVVQL
ncbi:uncharacterized protein HMPREF1541_03262 [Cyphellophora europaea CBS 101466]|uniref:Uncharacterized protein n=1 Tax=Cyphellophora europaea (strain CBS 101466) TaxID=1220924 RepID=W2RY04_CYPE1|nr:uncharacterized protein HMPREF1541_03262 [Cyphellophora europaea CBS 101466]ETN41327.1 hypothetical protein HMPREF1541_03262 [Cyphellophora europaea CBS 101466]